MPSEKSNISQFQSENALKNTTYAKNGDKDPQIEKFDPIKECNIIMLQRK